MLLLACRPAYRYERLLRSIIQAQCSSIRSANVNERAIWGSRKLVLNGWLWVVAAAAAVEQLKTFKVVNGADIVSAIDPVSVVRRHGTPDELNRSDLSAH